MNTTRPAAASFDYLMRTTESIVAADESYSFLNSNRPLRIKYGVDLTGSFLHIGHAVNLWMMRHLQECGHKVVFLIGDFTTRIGDPTGKSQTRPEITQAEIEHNAEEFIDQVGRILLLDSNVFEIRRNSEWYGKMEVEQFMRLLSMVTHAKLIQRDMFRKRIQEQSEIHMHEMLYPILQGYDSYMLESDLTIVGSDQMFNESMGRFFQEKLGQSPQAIVTTKITPGIDGINKQSKSLNNYIALSDTPRDKFGKIMSIPDELIEDYFLVYTDISTGEVDRIRGELRQRKANPMNYKKKLARDIVARYHGADEGFAQQSWFEETFSEKITPSDIPIVSVESPIEILGLLKACLPTDSNSQHRRLLQQGAVRVNDVRVDWLDYKHDVTAGDVVQVGKRRWFKLASVNQDANSDLGQE